MSTRTIRITRTTPYLLVDFFDDFVQGQLTMRNLRELMREARINERLDETTFRAWFQDMVEYSRQRPLQEILEQYDDELLAHFNLVPTKRSLAASGKS